MSSEASSQPGPQDAGQPGREDDEAVMSGQPGWLGQCEWALCGTSGERPRSLTLGNTQEVIAAVISDESCDETNEEGSWSDTAGWDFERFWAECGITYNSYKDYETQHITSVRDLVYHTPVSVSVYNIRQYPLILH